MQRDQIFKIKKSQILKFLTAAIFDFTIKILSQSATQSMD